MKKVLALVLALAMVFSTITVAFADATTTAAPETTAAEISAAAKTCADLGMLQGPSGTVDVAYTSTEPTRIQAAIMLLRLKGLEADAKAFTGEDNFADVAADYWAKPITAFLKAHPELGFIGDGKSFKANDKMDAKQYAKVLLTALGYNQTSAEVVGDYTWEGVVEFAKSKSLTLADSAAFSIDVLAQATVEALKATAKDGGKTLAASLVESGKMDAAKAEANGLYTAEKINIADDKVAPTVTKVESDDTNIIKVTFNKPVEKASAGNKDNYTVKRSGTTLNVKSIEVSGNKAVLTTEGMENAKTYTITVQNVKNLSGVAMKEKYSDTFTGTIDKKAPSLTKVNTKTNIRLNLVFNEELDKASAENVANYKITGAKGDLEIKSAKLIENTDPNSDDMDTVELITAPQKSGKYTVHVINVADDSVSLNKIAKEDTEDFSGKSKETSAPKVETSSELTRTLSSNKVLLTLKDESRINFETASNASNYSFNNDLTVESVEMLDATDDDCTAVVITTSEQDDDKSYTVTVKNVEDELGNAMDSKGVKASVGKGKTDDQSAPAVANIYATDTDEVKVVMTEIVDKASAENIGNYDFGTLGVEKAELDNDKKTVIITTAGEMDNKYYSVSIKGIKDLNGNEMVEETEGINNAAFVGYLDENTLDIEHPEIDYVDVESKTEVKIGFTEKVKVTAANKIVDGKSTSWNAPYCQGNGQPIITFVELSSNGSYTDASKRVKANFVGGYYYYGAGIGGYSEDGKVLELKLDGTLDTNKNYRVETIENVTDWAGNAIPASWIKDNNDDFDVSGSDSYSDMAEFDSIDQVRADRIDVTFTRPVKLKTTANEYTLAPDGSSTSAKFTDNGVKFKVVVRAANPLVARFSYAGGIPEKTYKFNLSSLFTSLQGYDAMDDDDDADSVNKITNDDKTEFVANSVDEDGPVVEEVTAIDNQTIKVTFDKNVDPFAGNYKLKWTTDEDKKDNCTLTVDSMWSAGNSAYLNMPNGKTFDVDYDYTLTVSNVKDRYNNVMKSDDFDFDAVENQPNGIYVAGVEQVNGTKANVYLSKQWLRNYYNEANQLATVLDKTTNITYNFPTAAVETTDDKGNKITINKYVGALVQYNRGWNNDANFEDCETDDFIFDIYAGNQTYVEPRTQTVLSAALVDAKKGGKVLPAFYAGGVFELNMGGHTYTWTVDEEDNMAGGIDVDGTTLTFDDGDADQNTIVEAYDSATNNLLAVSNVSSGSVSESAWNWEKTVTEIAGKVIFVVKKNNNVIHARLVNVTTPIKAPVVPVSSIAVTTQPTKTTYTVGDTFDPAGLVVTATYDDKTTAVVTDYTLSAPDMTTAGTKTVTVTLDGKTATFNITVNPAQSYTVNVTDFDSNFLMTVSGKVVGNPVLADYSTLKVRIYDVIVAGGTATPTGAAVATLNVAADGTFTGTIPATTFGYGFDIFDGTNGVKPVVELKVGNGL